MEQAWETELAGLELELWAWVDPSEKEPGPVGLVAVQIPGVGWCPAVATTEQTVLLMEPVMRQVASATGRTLLLVRCRFTAVEKVVTP